MKIEINIPEELLPAIRAEFLLSMGTDSNISIENYFEKSIIEFIRNRAEIYKVGPYYSGTIQPRFLKDGRGNPQYKGDDPVTYYVEYPQDNSGSPWKDGDLWTDENTNITYKYTSNINQPWLELID
jgi:hypothetical protein